MDLTPIMMPILVTHMACQKQETGNHAIAACWAPPPWVGEEVGQLRLLTFARYVTDDVYYSFLNKLLAGHSQAYISETICITDIK